MASAQDHVRDWLERTMTGCSFAHLAASMRDGLLMAEFPSIASVEDIDEVFTLAAAKRLPAIVILPGVRTEVAKQILLLAKGARWQVYRVPTPSALTTDDQFIGLEWQTAKADLRSSPMGLAPLGTMPPTRRAPYTCIAAWTGERLNAFRTRKDPVVHLLDTDLSGYSLTSAKYQKHHRKSIDATKKMLLDDSGKNYRNVAFRLSAAVAPQLASLPIAE